MFSERNKVHIIGQWSWKLQWMPYTVSKFSSLPAFDECIRPGWK